MPQEYFHHTYAVEDYLKALRKVSESVNEVVSRNRGTYFDKDSVRISKTTNKFILIELPGPSQIYKFELKPIKEKDEERATTPNSPHEGGGEK